MRRLTIKTSTIFIAKGGRTKVYHSVQEMPKQLRDELEQSTNGFNSATILIADRRGRQEIARALQGLPSGLRTRLATSLTPAEPSPAPAPWWSGKPMLRFARRNWLEVALPFTVGTVLWFAFNYR